MLEKPLFANIKNQVYATIVANCIILSFGSNIGWFSPALPILLSEDTPLITGPLTNEELSWIAAMNSFGSICGTFIIGLLSILCGSKRAMTFLAYPSIAFWLLIYYGNTFYHILMARFCNGLTGGGFQSGVVLFVSEISNDNMRGRLGAVVPVARSVGLLIAYIAGAIVKYEYRPYIFIFIPVIYLTRVHFLPSTAQYYLKKRDLQKAEQALMFYKGFNIKSDREKSLFKMEFEQMKLAEEERKKSPKLKTKDFCNRMALKGFGTSIAISWFFQTTGCYIITNYASLIFEISGSALSIHASAICLACIQLLGGLVSTQLGDTFSRKKTLIISLFGSAIGLFTFAAYSYLRHTGYDVSKYMWQPVMCLSLVIFISSSGIVALANTVTLENFPPKIRPAGMVFYSLVLNAIALLGEKFFPILLEMIHLHGFMLFLGINCCIGIIFVCFMKETIGKSIEF